MGSRRAPALGDSTGGVAVSLQFTRLEFEACPACRSKPGAPALCGECLERRELIGAVVEAVRTGSTAGLHVCRYCNGIPSAQCPRHGR